MTRVCVIDSPLLPLSSNKSPEDDKTKPEVGLTRAITQTKEVQVEHFHGVAQVNLHTQQSSEDAEACEAVVTLAVSNPVFQPLASATLQTVSF